MVCEHGRSRADTLTVPPNVVCRLAGHRVHVVELRRPRFMQLAPAGPLAEVDRYIGYWKSYATNHEELDADTAIQGEVRNAAQTLLEAVIAQRDGQFVAAGKDLEQPRQK